MRSQGDFNTVIDIENMILRAGNGETVEIPDTIVTKYKDDLQIDRLSTHLKMLPDMRKKFSEQGCTTIKKITNVQTVCQLMNEIPGAKVLFTELHRLLQLFLTIPVTTATSERTFSAMRRLKKIFSDLL